MISKVDQHTETIVQEILDFAEEDWVGIWVIISEIKQKFNIKDISFVRQMTMNIVTEILKRGLKAGDTPYSKKGFVEWPDQRPEYVIKKIEIEWELLGKEPDIGDIVYFGK